VSTKKPRIFVSHAWEDNALVSRLENELKLAGAELWVDLSDVRAGDIITSRVNKALGWCDTLVLVWSHAASHSKWVEQEWGAAFNAKKRIVPCKTDDELLPILLTNIAYIDLRIFDQGITDLFRALSLSVKSKEPKAKPIEETPLKSPRVFPETKDDPAFLVILDKIIAATVFQDSLLDVYIIRIDNWFDHKWLRFSGIGRISPEEADMDSDVALDEFHLERITFPPFTPNRVLAQRYFHRNTKGLYEEQSFIKLVHQEDREQSVRNLQRRIVDFADSAVFCWFSSNSVQNQKGSMMVYSLQDNHVLTWYASFSKNRNWKLDRVKGITHPEVESLIQYEKIESYK